MLRRLQHGRGCAGPDYASGASAMNAREPMARLSHEPTPEPRSAFPLYRAAAIAVIACVLWTLVAAEYRAQHCVQLFGHWLAMDQPATVFCQ